MNHLALKLLSATTAQVTNAGRRAAVCVMDCGPPGSRVTEGAAVIGETSSREVGERRHWLSWVPVATTSTGLIITRSTEELTGFHRNFVKVVSKYFDEKWGHSTRNELFSKKITVQNMNPFNSEWRLFSVRCIVCVCYFVVFVVCVVNFWFLRSFFFFFFQKTKQNNKTVTEIFFTGSEHLLFIRPHLFTLCRQLILLEGRNQRWVENKA